MLQEYEKMKLTPKYKDCKEEEVQRALASKLGKTLGSISAALSRARAVAARQFRAKSFEQGC